MYGSGWVWLVDKNGILSIVSTHDNYSAEATSETITAILCLDLWEHSYWPEYGIQKDVCIILIFFFCKCF